MEGAPVQQSNPSAQRQSTLSADQVLRLPQLNNEQKAQYSERVRQLWNKLNSLQGQENTNEYRQAQTNLFQISASLVKGARQFQAARQQQQAQHAQNQAQVQAQAQAHAQQQAQQQQATMGQAQQQGQQNAPMPQQDQAGQQMQQQPQRPPPQFYPQVMAKVQATRFILPPNIQEPAEKEKWLREAKMRFGQALQRTEVAKQRVQEMNNKVTQRRAAGHTFTQEEQNEYQEKKRLYEQHLKEGGEFLQRFKQQQDTFRNQAIGQQPGGGVLPKMENAQPNAATTGTEQLSVARAPQNQNPSTQGPSAHTITSAVNAARQASVSQGIGSPVIKQEPGVPQSAASTTAPSSFPQPASNPSMALPTSTPTQPSNQMDNSLNNTPVQPQPPPQNPNQNQQANANQPLPLTQELARARANSSYTGQPSTPQTANPHAHPSVLNREREFPSSSTKFPIPKQLNVPSPSPVQMAPSRPTYSGGPTNQAAMMGQPGIQQTPGYVLESDGQHVLSKKKLRELVMQVTGGHDSLTTDAEEVFLDLADTFIDSVTTAACRVAKLRAAPQLELRDLQLVLERNYNIRVPGYCSDELRTVKRYHPTAGWFQKVGAVQAAKVTGGVGGKEGSGEK